MNTDKLYELASNYLKVCRSSVGGSIIIVDVQPEYSSNIKFDIGEMLRRASLYNRVLVLWNGPDLGMVSKSNLLEYYFEKLDYEEGVIEELLSKSTFYDKGYGFFRDLMSHPCFNEEAIVSIVKYMIGVGKSDIRELDDSDILNIGVSELLVEDLENYGFWVPEDLVDLIRGWGGSDIVGGQEEECLAEVEIVGRALGIKLNKLTEYIY